jgi:hypothetical protein
MSQPAFRAAAARAARITQDKSACFQGFPGQMERNAAQLSIYVDIFCEVLCNSGRRDSAVGDDLMRSGP